MRPLICTVTLLLFALSTISYAQSFQKQIIAPDKSISDIHMVNASIGYAGGVDGVYKTTNGGTNWQLLPYFVATGDWLKDYYPTNFNVVHLHFFNELSGIAYGWHSFNYEMVMATTDGGVTWSLKHFYYPDLIHYSFNYLNSLHVFDDASMIIAGNSGRILKTTDGGDHWTGTKIDDEETDLKKIQFTSSTLGYAAGERRFYTSSDAGNHWSMRKLNFEINDFHFFDSQKGIALASSGNFFKTTDGGKTWTAGLMQAESSLTHIKFINNLIGYASGYTGLIYKTTDGGETWLKIYTDGNEISSSFLLTQDIIWFSVEKGYLLYTGNGGAITVPNPTITSITPASGKIGDMVTINGTNLSSVLGVKFNGIPAGFKLSAGSITTEIPRKATSGKIELVTPNGSVFTATDYPISQAPKLYQPIVSTLGTTVVIEGENLQYLTEVTYGGFHFDFNILSSQQFSFFLPEDFILYPVPVLTVTSAFGSASMTLPLAGKPNITNIAAKGAPGTSVTLTGSSLLLTSEVKFGNIPADYFEVISSTEIKCIVPDVAEKQSAPIHVVTPAGVGTSAGDFTIYPAPEILSITPTVLKAGEDITITGNNLPEMMWSGSVYVNGIRIVEHQAREIDSHTLIVKMPELSLGIQEITIKIMNESGVSTTYLATVDITGRLPYYIENVTPIRDVYRNLTHPAIITGFFPRIDSLTINGLKHEFDSYSTANYITFVPNKNTTTGFISIYTNGQAITYPEEYVITDNASPRFDFTPKTVTVGQRVNITGIDLRYIESVTVNGQYVPFNLSDNLWLDLPITIIDGTTSGYIKITTPDGSFESHDILHVLPADQVKPIIYRCDHGYPFDDYYVRLIGDNFSTVTAVRYDQYYADYTLVHNDTLLVKIPKNINSKNVSTSHIVVESPAGQGEKLFFADFGVMQTIVSASPLTGKRGTIITVKLSDKIPYVKYPDYYNFILGNTMAKYHWQIDDTTFLVEVPLEGDVEGKIGIAWGTSYLSDLRFTFADDEYCTSTGVPNPILGSLKKLMIQGQTVDVPNEGFIDNTSQPIDVIPGQSLRLGVTTLRIGTGAKIFVDWNGDKEFNEAGTLMIAGDIPPLDTMVYVTLNVPSTVKVGTSTKLRIITGGSDLQPCGIKYSGQVIDYKLNFTAPSSTLKISDFYPAVGTTDTKVTIVGDNLNAIQTITLNGFGLAINLVNEYTAEVIIPEGATDGNFIFSTANETVTSPRKFVIDNTITPPTEADQNFKYTYRATINGKDVAFYLFAQLGQPYTFIQTVQEFPESGTLCLYTPGGELCFDEPIRFPSRINFPDPFEVVRNQQVILTGANLSQVAKIFLDGDENIPFTVISDDSLSFIAPESESDSRIISIFDPFMGTLEHDMFFQYPDTGYCDQNVGWKEGCELIEVNFKQIANKSGKNTTGGRSDYTDQVAILDLYNAYYLDFKVKNFGNKNEAIYIQAYLNLEDANGVLHFEDQTFLGPTDGINLQAGEVGIVHPYIILPPDIETDKPITIWFVLSYYSSDTPCGSLIAEIEKYTIFVKQNHAGSSLQISSMSKTTALANDEIEITGTDFDKVKSLQIGELPVPFTLISPNTIRFIVPTGASTEFIKVTALDSDAQSPNELKIIQPHTVTSLDPAVGKAGDAILIHGTNLNYVTSIAFNDIVANNFIALSSKTLRVTVPASVSTGPLHLKNQFNYEVNSETFHVCDGISINQYCKADQSITFSDLVNVTYGQTPFNLTATASSSLPIAYTSSNVSVATIVGNKVTIIGPGTTLITALQSGNSSYNPAPSIQRSLTVNKASQTITFNSLNPVKFGQIPFLLTASTSAGLPVSFTSSNTAVASIAGNTVTIVGVGSATITATQSGNNYYDPAASIGRNLTVDKAPQIITFNLIPDVLQSSLPVALQATASSGLVVVFSSEDDVTINNQSLTSSHSGRVTVHASQTGNATYGAAPPVDRSFCIIPLKPTIVVDETSPGVYTITASSASVNHWFLNETEIENENAQALHVAKSGTYKVKTQVDDCVSDFSEGITVVITGTEKNIAEAVIYPNPVKGKLLIESTKPFTEVLIASVTGTILQTTKNDSFLNHLEMDLTELKNGIYILEIYQEDELISREKIIKE
jgi:photosystem II stability/assembly factor-like uncharacterized protein